MPRRHNEFPHGGFATQPARNKTLALLVASRPGPNSCGNDLAIERAFPSFALAIVQLLFYNLDHHRVVFASLRYATSSTTVRRKLSITWPEPKAAFNPAMATGKPVEFIPPERSRGQYWPR
jgi:hypothetical protein